MRRSSMKAGISSGANARGEGIPPVFQQWHAAKVIEGNLGGHAVSLHSIKSSIASMCRVRDSISASEVNTEALHGVGWPHSIDDVEDSTTSSERREPACRMTVLVSEKSHSREGRRI